MAKYNALSHDLGLCWPDLMLRYLIWTLEGLDPGFGQERETERRRDIETEK